MVKSQNTNLTCIDMRTVGPGKDVELEVMKGLLL